MNDNNTSCCDHDWRKPKTIILVLVVMALTAIVIVALVRDRIVNNNQWQISVTGQGKVAYQPDTAKIILGYQADKAPQADVALKQLNAKMNEITKAVVASGIAMQDIQTQNYSLYPQYDYVDNVSKVGGYSANQMLIIKIKDIQSNPELTTKVLAAATTAGANQVNGVYFESSKINDLRQEARLKAIADAQTKSGAIAKELHARLGKVVGWWENTVYSPETNSYYADGKGGVGAGYSVSPNVPTGTQELIIEASVNYKLK
ncbi:MAG: SIMPL domain-containing protein [Patescibacteria group bacterium]|jgi:hypothetical protein